MRARSAWLSGSDSLVWACGLLWARAVNAADPVSWVTRMSTGPVPAVMARSIWASVMCSVGNQFTPSVRHCRSVEVAPPRNNILIPAMVSRSPRGMWVIDRVRAVGSVASGVRRVKSSWLPSMIR